jgi:predicted cobalt transporter CbtA
MARERRGIEQVRYRADWVRGVGFLAILVGVTMAAVRSGGWQGGLFGAACFLIAIAIALWWWRHRSER